MARATVDPAHLGWTYSGANPTTRSLGGGRWLWSPLVVTLDDPDRPVVATVTVVTGADGRSRAMRIEVYARDEGDEVTAATARLPVDEIVRLARRVAATEGPDAPPGALPQVGRPMMWRGGDDEVALPRRHTRKPRDEARLRQVAEVYKKAPPGRIYETVREKLELHSENTARNLIAEARKAGYLPEYKKGQR